MLTGAAMKFIYNSGQRPLDGYTLKRGIGRGGFGEVYYAVSDGGKDVALKLVNILIGNGSVKAGDYGLSKFISSSQRTAQTQSVGTVHYMAPEISTGNYSKQIDIYAAGIILYEMLTGRVPFDGESAGEILMKHLTSPPDLSKLAAEYIPIVGKALAKNPLHRFASLAEMAKAVAAVGQEDRAA